MKSAATLVAVLLVFTLFKAHAARDLRQSRRREPACLTSVDCRTAITREAGLVCSLEQELCVNGSGFTVLEHDFLGAARLFAALDPERLSPFTIFPVDFPQDAGSAQVNGGGQLVISAEPFKATVAGGVLGVNDHLKYVFASNNNVLGSVPLDSSVTLEVAYSCSASGMAGHSFPSGTVRNSSQDFRLGACAAGLISVDQSLSFDIVATDTALYALYWHFPFTRSLQGIDYHAFGGVKKLADLRGPGVPIVASLKMDLQNNTVTFLYRDQPALVITAPGMVPDDPAFVVLADWGGEDLQVNISSAQAFFGLMTDLDMADPVAHLDGSCNSDAPPPGCETGLVQLDQAEDSTGYVFPPGWVDAEGLTPEYRLWGQGAIMVLDWLRIREEPGSALQTV